MLIPLGPPNCKCLAFENDTQQHTLLPQPANFLLRDRKSNPLGSPNDTRVYALPWLAAIDLGCAQHLGPDVSVLCLFWRAASVYVEGGSEYAGCLPWLAVTWAARSTLNKTRFKHTTNCASLRHPTVHDAGQFPTLQITHQLYTQTHTTHKTHTAIRASLWHPAVHGARDFQKGLPPGGGHVSHPGDTAG